MPVLRWTPLVFALLSMGASTCGPSTPDPKPATSASAAPAELKVPGVDASSLTPRERRDWTGQLGELLAPCPDTPVTIAQCIQENRGCKGCVPAADFLLKQVQAGKPKKDREDAFRARFDPAKVKTLVLDGSPEKGAPDAVVTIVEWADFQCPFCRLVYPMLEGLYDRFEGQVRVVYKFYPLQAHPNGEIAARAAIAALNQGKFWEMHHLLFDNQEKLEQADLERYAKKLDLDLAKFRADLNADDTTARIERDKKQADGLGLEGTPFMFINGREVDLSMLTAPYDDLEAWVKLDIELAGKTPRPPKPAPSVAASASAAVAGSAAPAAGSAAPAAGTATPGKK